MIALFGLMLFADRQTGGLLQGAFILALPIPMTAYSVRYDLRASLTVCACMCLISIFFGTFTTVFYACSQSLLGLIFGALLRRKVNPTQVLFCVMLLSVVSTVLNLILDMALFGYDLTAEIQELLQLMTNAVQTAGNAMPEYAEAAEQTIALFTPRYIGQLFILSMLLCGLVQGFLIYQLTLLLLKRLHFPVERPRSLFSYYPPRWIGFLSLALFMGYSASLVYPLADGLRQSILMLLGTAGFLYLAAFGFVAVLLAVQRYLPSIRPAGGLVGLAAILLLPQGVMLLGLFYASTDFHRRLLEG